jgi:mono/diheme cytochrome c family protein
MVSRTPGISKVRLFLPALLVVATAGVVAAFPGTEPPEPHGTVAPTGDHAFDANEVERGRTLVLEHACSGCHGGNGNPTAENWLVGITSPEEEWHIGPCGRGGDETCFVTRPRNLTPDNRTGMGRFSERQIFNALRFGLRPGETEDVQITSMTPGEGNFPEHPKYLAPPMPWTAWRHIPDEDLWAIAAYLKHGVKPVSNRVLDSEGPPDFWASAYTVEEVGTYPAPPFPTAHEQEPPEGADRALVLEGRQQVIQHDCGGCHTGGADPAADGWLAGMNDPGDAFPIGPCAMDPEATPCFWQRPRNLTPDDETGMGGYTDRQIFNALRFGLRPSAATDVEITSTVAGEGNHPEEPDYLGVGMPWPHWRHMSDQDLRAIAAYLKHGVKPVVNAVEDSDSPPDLWASEYTAEKIGSWPPVPFPTEREVAPTTAPTGQ